MYKCLIVIEKRWSERHIETLREKNELIVTLNCIKQQCIFHQYFVDDYARSSCNACLEILMTLTNNTGVLTFMLY